MTFQERIKQAFEEEAARRADAGEPRLTKTDVWKAADASSGAATHWFNGSNGMDMATCMKVAHLLRVNAQWLYDGTGPKRPDGSSEQAAPAPTPAPWPFPDISEKDVRALPPSHINALQGALAVVIAQLKLGVRVTESPKATSRLVDMDTASDEFPMRVDAGSQHWEQNSAAGRVGAGSLRLNQMPNVGHVARAGYSANDQEFVSIPELDVRLAAGPLGIENYHETEIGEILFRRTFLESFKLPIERMKIVYADGDSMEPVIRNEGPMLFFEDPVTDQRKIDPRTVYAINLGGEMVVKCIQRERDGTLLAKSLNPVHPPFPLKLDNGQDVRIVGRILWSPYDLRNGVDERLL
ncbi:phage repressor protein [Achromobacter spanius]|uniref:S24 family peptidase n=1 Tax=Achromobacter spanius TaxID=217203 RepID=UPI002226F1B0|nr:LexA family transcriptional regulator [Achromobacter spanius]MCW3151925.1 phage repressor protein [Achromobacter spanius]